MATPQGDVEPPRVRTSPAGTAVFRLLVPLTALGAGLLFALSASTAQGSDLRAERREVTGLIEEQARDVELLEEQARRLRREVADQSGQAAAGDGRVSAEQARATALAESAGLTEVTGPGVRVSLDDAPRPEGGEPASDNPDDLVVHQQDLQAVVNALWAGGAEAMTLMGQRIVSTSAVRCVGNTVVLHGQVYGPPFVVEAIGDPATLRDSLDSAPGVAFFRTFVDRFGLGFDVSSQGSLTLPPYEGSLDLTAVTRR